MGKLLPPPADPWLNWLDKKLDEKPVRFRPTVDLLRPWHEMQNTPDGPPPEKRGRTVKQINQLALVVGRGQARLLRASAVRTAYVASPALH